MSNVNERTKEKIAVGIACDHGGETLLQVSSALARRIEADLRLVHVMMPPPSFKLYNVYAGLLEFGEYEAMTARVRKAERSSTKAFFDGLRIPPELQKSTSKAQIEAPKPATALITDALGADVSLIMVGTSADSHKFAARGRSTALSLAGTSPLPIMVVRLANSPDFARSGTKILIFDDLMHDCDGAVETGLKLACSLGHAEVTHVHVVEARLAALAGSESQDAMEAAKNIEERAEAENWPPFCQRVHDQLRARAAPFAERLRARECNYITRCLSGDIGDKVFDSVESMRPDVAVFGRARSILHRPLGLGHIPYADIFAACPAVVVAPSVG